MAIEGILLNMRRVKTCHFLFSQASFAFTGCSTAKGSWYRSNVTKAKTISAKYCSFQHPSALRRIRSIFQASC